MKAGYLLWGYAGFQPHGQEPTHISNGMESAVKVPNLIDRVFHGRGDFEQAEIFRVDQLTGQELACDEGVPVVPIVATGGLETYDRLGIAFASLGEGLNFTPFILRPDTARE